MSIGVDDRWTQLRQRINSDLLEGAAKRMVLRWMDDLEKPAPYYTITKADIGKSTIIAWGKAWHVSSFIGRILGPKGEHRGDVGKRVYRVETAAGDHILQVENDSQFLARLRREAEEHVPVTPSRILTELHKAKVPWTPTNKAGYRFPHKPPCDCPECGEAMVAQRAIRKLLRELDELDPSLAAAFRLDLFGPEPTATPDKYTAELLGGMVASRKKAQA